MITDAISTILVIPRVPRISLRFLGILGFILIVSFLAGYIFQVSEITRVGFLITEYEKQITEFSQESQSLESSFASLSSLTNLETILNHLDYEKVSKVHYLRVPGVQVFAK